MFLPIMKMIFEQKKGWFEECFQSSHERMSIRPSFARHWKQNTIETFLVPDVPSSCLRTYLEDLQGCVYHLLLIDFVWSTMEAQPVLSFKLRVTSVTRTKNNTTKKGMLLILLFAISITHFQKTTQQQQHGNFEGANLAFVT